MDELLKRMAEEIKNLKQYREKSGQEIVTQETTLSLQFDMEYFLDRWMAETIRSDTSAILTIQSTTGVTPLTALYFDVTDMEGRRAYIKKGYSSVEGQVKYQISIVDFDFDANSDYATLTDGGSVQLDYDVVLVSTAPVTVSIEYDNLWID